MITGLTLSLALAFATVPHPALEDQLPLQSSVLSLSEQAELVGLLRAENHDLQAKLVIMEDKVALWKEAVSACQDSSQGQERLYALSQETCLARIDAEAASCDCPPLLFRRVNTGLTFSIGLLAGRGFCTD